MAFFLSNTVESQLMASGAFEIFYNGKLLFLRTKRLTPYSNTLFPVDVPIWSKIATGRIPSAQELFTMIENQFKFYAGNEVFGETHTIPGPML